jgi:SAM-dependent methyltransferase
MTEQTIRRLNVGCGRNILEGWINLDGFQHPGVDVVYDLEWIYKETNKWALPFENETIDEFYLSHVIEHIRNVYPLMQELYRVAKPNALMTIRVPYGSSDDAWEDQTHIRAYFPQSFGYFGQPYHWKVPAGGYGYTADWKWEKITLRIDRAILTKAAGDVDMLNQWLRHERNIVREMICTLRKVDPPRPADQKLVALPPIIPEAVE